MLRTMALGLRPLLLTGLALAALPLLGPASPARADKVGVAAAVHPDAYSEGSEIKIGNSVFYNQRINTTGSGLVQVLLVDGSTFTVGPGSDLVIDKFVYDPNKNKGEMVATLGKGVLRFVGGKLSKNDGGVTVNTPSGALAIRGGMFQGKVDGHNSVFCFLFGVEMKLTGPDGQVHRVYTPGYTIDLSSGTPTIRPTTEADTNGIMKSLSGGGHVVVGADNIGNQGGNQGNTGNTKANTLASITSTASQTQSTSQVQNQQNQTNPPPQNSQLTARVLTSPGTYTAFPSTPDQFTSYDAGKKGILGGDANHPPVTVDDFTWPFSLVNGRTVGTVSGLIEDHQECSGSPDPSCQTVPRPINPAQIDFPAPGTGLCVNGVCAVTDATITQLNNQSPPQVETTTYVGESVGEPGFFAYQLINKNYSLNSGNGTNNNNGNNKGPDPILSFGGKAFDFGQPSGKLYLFDLTPDAFQVSQGGAIGPFASAGSSPTVDLTKPLPSVSPLEMLTSDAAKSGSRTVWLQTSLYINTTPANTNTTSFDQQSFVNVALGGQNSTTGGLVGARRGGANVDVSYQNNCNGGCTLTPNPIPTTRDPLAFTGDIATLAGPDGSTFLGTANPNIVIGIDTTGTHNIGRDIPLFNQQSAEQNSGATYHVGIGAPAPTVGVQTNATVNGYAAGLFVQTTDNPYSNDSPVGALVSKNPGDVSIAFNAQQNTLAATFNLNVTDQHVNAGVDNVNVDNGNQGGATIGFGDPQGSSGHSAFIDDQHYAAIETPGATTVYTGQDHTAVTPNSATAYLVSGDQINVTKFFPETFGPPDATGNSPAFCTSCDFLKWGAWGTRLSFQDNSGSNVTADVHLGWWAAANIPAVGDLPSTGGATYTGHALGDVAANVNNGGWKTYVAAGDMSMGWDFAKRLGTLAISNFDVNGPMGPLNVSGTMTTPGQLASAANSFNGSLGGTLGISPIGGAANGSFARGPGQLSGAIPAGVMGNWNVANQVYKATGIFAGSGIPTHP